MGKITCKINEDLTIALVNVQKTYGHDDSLPFQADIHVKSEKLGLPELTRIGRAFNDGWGGDTVIESAHYRPLLNEIEKYLTQNYQIHIKKPEISWAVRLDYLISIMAERSIFGHQTKMNIMDMEDCEKVEPLQLQYPSANGQKYSYAECVVQTALDTKEVTIALASRDKLGIKKDSPEDKTIFAYCDGGYEEFIEMIAKDPVFTSAEDFNIKSILKLK
jgi:hypothetical protein